MNEIYEETKKETRHFDGGFLPNSLGVDFGAEGLLAIFHFDNYSTLNWVMIRVH